MEDERLTVALQAADVYRRARRYRQMLAVAQDAIALAPDDARGYLLAGQALTVLKQYEEAQRFYTGALAREPNSDWAHYLQAMLHWARRAYDLAEEHLHQACELRPTVADYWATLGELTLGRSTAPTMAPPSYVAEYVRLCAEKALQLDPNNASALNLLGRLAQSSRTAAGARAAVPWYLKALESDPANNAVLDNVGTAYVDLKDYAAAEQYFRRALAIDPHDDVARENLYGVLRHRSLIYWMLTSWWTTFVIPLAAMVTELAIVGVSRPPVITMCIACAAWTFPVVQRAYRSLMIADVKAEAGEVGRPPGGWLQFRRWPFGLRVAVFFGGVLALWAAPLLGILLAGPRRAPDAARPAGPFPDPLSPFHIAFQVSLVVLLAFAPWAIVRWIRRRRVLLARLEKLRRDTGGRHHSEDDVRA